MANTKQAPDSEAEYKEFLKTPKGKFLTSIEGLIEHRMSEPALIQNIIGWHNEGHSVEAISGLVKEWHRTA